MFEAAPEAPGGWRRGGVSLLGTEEPSKQGLTQKKILNRGKGSQQSVDVIPLFGKKGVDVIPPLSSLFPFCVSAYGQSTLFPSSKPCFEINVYEFISLYNKFGVW